MIFSINAEVVFCKKFWHKVIKLKYRSYNPDQLRLLPLDLTEMISSDSAMWFVKDAINGELIRDIETKKSEEGNSAYNPVLMCRLLTWAYYNGICSSRQIERRTYTDVEFIYLCDNQHPNFRTICSFRKKFEDALCGLYKKIYRLALRTEVTNIGLFSIDGTAVKGNVSGKKGVKTLESWKEKEKKLDAEIREYERRSAELDSVEDSKFGKDGNGGLPDKMRQSEYRLKKIREVCKKLNEEEVAEKTRVSLTDPDARMIKKSSSGGYVMGYNAGLAVDANRLIAHVELINTADDYKILSSCVAGLEETLGGVIPEGTKILADAGCTSSTNATLLEDKKLDGYLNTTNEFKSVCKTATTNSETKLVFDYDEERDVFICPIGCHLARHSTYTKTRFSGGKKKLCNYVKYRSIMSCKGCQLASQCKPGDRNHKYLDREEGFESLERMRKKMSSPGSSDVYVLRRSTVEPAIGDLKENHCCRSMRIRGFSGMVELCLGALCHNLKIVFNLTKNFVRPLQTAMR
jgi:transposase